ncbi:MAG TPA: GNAT family N-acetyltransferase [Candidatus Saccharimonadia bacterium]|nr:GNAT family N-acetyltransferase [Candidatus Saccharimonadia bacterium]
MKTGLLELRPLAAAAAGALLDDRPTAARLIGASIPPTWPQDDLLDVMPMQAATGPGDERFGIWLIIERATNAIVGDVGFLGPPEDGIVELGFSVVPDQRRRGFASEATRALIAWALREPGVRGVIARSDIDNVASMRVLQAAGFTRTGEAGGRILWRLEQTRSPISTPDHRT